MTSTIPYNYTKSLALLSSGLLAGSTLYVSTSTIPSILSASPPAHVLQTQWASIYNQGKKIIPPAAILNSSLFGYLWAKGEGTGWLVAAGCSAGIIPFTLVFMFPNIGRIEGWKKGGEVDKEGVRLEKDVRLWGRLHAVRAVMLMTAFGVVIGEVMGFVA